MDLLKAFLNNMTLIISFVYIMIMLNRKFKRNESFVTSVFTGGAGIVSVLAMTQPFQYEGMIFDLRHVPVFIVSYIVGPFGAAVSVVLPFAYRIWSGGATAISGAALAILLPAVIGALFSEEKKEGVLRNSFDVRRAIAGYAAFVLIHIPAGYFLLRNSVGIETLFYFSVMIAMDIFGIAAILLIFAMMNDEVQRVDYERKLEHRTSHDALTGIYNRDYFYRNLNYAVRGVCEDGGCSASPDMGTSLVMFDIDHFKMVNDTFGHDVGDSVLRELSQVVADSIRKTDILARVGGEEFAVILAGTSVDEAASVAEKIRSQVERHSFDQVGKVTISLGISELSDGDDIDSLYKRADNALYKAKRGGRNRVEVEYV